MNKDLFLAARKVVYAAEKMHQAFEEQDWQTYYSATNELFELKNEYFKLANKLEENKND